MRRAIYQAVLPLALVGWMLPLAGCEVQRDGEETRVKIDGQEVEQNLEQAGQELGAAAEQAGQAIEEGTREIREEVGPIAKEVLDDASVTTRVKARLMADPEVNAFHIDVDTLDGLVTLNGRVASDDLRAEAEKLARRTEGVKDVRNLIQVAGS